MRFLTLLLALSACGGPSETRFLVDGYGTWCDRSAECAGTFQASACIDELRSQDRSSCTYDPALARDCMDELEEAECVADPNLDLPRLTVPESCMAVYDCGAAG